MLLSGTLEALAAAGTTVDLVFPVSPGEDGGALGKHLAAFCRPHPVEQRGRSVPAAILRSLVRRTSWTIERHRSVAIQRVVESLAHSEPYDALIAEQLQAWPQVRDVRGAVGVPRVLRAQNVESDLWTGAAGIAPLPGVAPVLREQARRLARVEGGAVREASGTVALTEADAARLEALAEQGGGGGRTGKRRGPIEVITAPFPARLDGAVTSEAPSPLPGSPALVLLGSGGWLPNRDQTHRFLETIWPAVRERVPGARLHLFGPAPKGVGANEGGLVGVVAHPAPLDSADAMPQGSILVVPVRVASGLRMKILEAWTRGVPVLSSPEGAAGLDAIDGTHLLIASSPADWAVAVERMQDPALVARLVAGGRTRLADRHAPHVVAARWIELVGRLAPGVAASHPGSEGDRR